MKNRLESVSNVAIILGVLILGGLMARDRLGPTGGKRNVGDLKPGVRLDPPAAYDWSKQPYTLLVALRDGCKYCEQSVPFYQRLAAREREHQLSAHLLAVIASSESAARDYAASLNLTWQFLPNADFAKLKIPATPTLILIDASGQVRQAWVGALTDAAEAEVLRAVGR